MKGLTPLDGGSCIIRALSPLGPHPTGEAAVMIRHVWHVCAHGDLCLVGWVGGFFSNW